MASESFYQDVNSFHPNVEHGFHHVHGDVLYLSAVENEEGQIHLLQLTLQLPQPHHNIIFNLTIISFFQTIPDKYFTMLVSRLHS
jgi:hypothetical protein